MKFRIGYKIALFTALIIALAGFVMWQAVQASAKYIVYRENIDLQDEAVSRGHDLLEVVRLFREDILRLSTGEYGGTRFVDAEDGVDAEKAQAALRTLFQWRRDYLLVATLELGDDGSVRPGPLAAAQGAAVSLDDVPQPFLKELAASGPFEVRLSRVRDARAAAGPSVPVLWGGTRLAARRGLTQGEDGGRFIVAALHLGPMFESVDGSPRHLSFLTQGDQYFLIHPNRRFSLGHGGDSRTPLSQGEFFQVPPRLPPDADSVIRWWFDHYWEMAHSEEDAGEIKRQGWLERDFSLRPDVAVWYQQSEKLDAELLGDPARFDAIDQWLEQAHQQADFIERFGPLARLGGLSKSVGRVRFRAGSREQLAQLAAHLRQAFARRWDIDLGLERPVDCETFTLHFFKLNYDPIDGDYFGLVQGVSQEEIYGEAIAEMKPIITSVALALLAVAAAALLFTWRLTRPLQDITDAARSFGASDVESETWGRVVPAIKSKLPVRRQDEIGLLAATFYRMIDEIVRSHEELRGERNLLDRRVEQRTAELKTTNQELLIARDEAESANRATERFVASVSHELRTPLNHIMGFCQLLELTELDEQQQEDLEKISHAGKYLLGLVNDILDYQRIIMGVVDLELEEFAVAPFLRETADAMQIKATENGNTLRVECTDAGTLYADPKRVRQIVLNLLTNACKFTRDGTITLGCARARQGGTDWVRLTVSDTGRGMSPAQQKKLFTPFAKLADRQGNKDGTGLGLVITKGFCERMGGTIDFESAEGRGTTCTVRLPARVSEDAARADGAPSRTPRRARAATAADRDNGGPARRRPGVVLVVDDDPNIRDLMQRFLEQRGFAVRTAASGEEGLRLAKELRPCAVTLDAVMPGMDGWEMLAALKTNEQTSDIPVVMVTILDHIGKGFSLGVSDYLVKPVDWDVLAATLRKYDGTPGDVLVVDDDPELRQVLRRLLGDAGWTVHEAENGRVGLERLRAVHPKVVLLDLMMPEMDGFEFVEEVQRDPLLRDVPIYVLTAKDPTPDERRRLNGGVERILQKGAHGHEEILQCLHERLLKTLCSEPQVHGAIETAT